VKIPEDACINCKRWTWKQGRSGTCRLEEFKGEGVDASGICLKHVRVSRKVENERDRVVTEEVCGEEQSQTVVLR